MSYIHMQIQTMRVWINERPLFAQVETEIDDYVTFEIAAWRFDIDFMEIRPTNKFWLDYCVRMQPLL